MIAAQELRFQFYHELESIYRNFCTELAAANLTEKQTSDLIEVVMRSRTAALNQLVSVNELDHYFQAYPESK